MTDESTRPQRLMREGDVMKTGVLLAVALAGASVSLVLAEDAQAGCTMKPQCVMRSKIEYRTTYTRECDTTRQYNGVTFVPVTTCRTRPITSPYPVHYEDCSKVVKVCDGLGSLISSKK